MLGLRAAASWKRGRPQGAPIVREPSSFDASTLAIAGGGNYSGLALRVSGADDAISVQTLEPVVIENSWIEHERGHGIHTSAGGPGTNITIRNCVIKGNYPTVAGEAVGRSIRILGPTTLTIENNWIESGGGIWVLDHQGGLGALHVRYNQARDIDGRYSDGAGGYRTGNVWAVDMDLYQFFQTNACLNMSNAEISWNEVINAPFSSRVEDCMNFGTCSGTPSHRVAVHHNVCWGAYPIDPAFGFSGGGILLADGQTNKYGYVHGHNNTIIGTINYGIAIPTGGANNTAENNRCVCSGRDEVGNVYTATNVGVYVSNTKDAPKWNNNDSIDNWARWWKPYTETRNDYYLPDCTGVCTVESGLPEDEVGWADELAEWQRWEDSRMEASVTIGPSGW